MSAYGFVPYSQPNPALEMGSLLGNNSLEPTLVGTKWEICESYRPSRMNSEKVFALILRQVEWLEEGRQFLVGEHSDSRISQHTCRR